MDRRVLIVYRQVTYGYNVTNESPEENPLISPPQTAITVKRGNRCSNAVKILIIYAVSIFLINFGALHMKDCPAQPKLPIILVVFGGIYFTLRLVNCVYDCKSVFGDEDEYPVSLGFVQLNVLYGLLQLAVFITLCVYAFSMDPTVKPEDQNLPNYCNKELYLTGYWLSVSGLIVCAFAFCFVCCIACLSD